MHPPANRSASRQSLSLLILCGVVLLVLLAAAPLCYAEVRWDGSTVTFEGAQWTNARYLRISYYGSADYATNDSSPRGLPWPRASGDVVLPDGGFIRPEREGITMYDGPPGVSGMVVWCSGEGKLPLTRGNGVKHVTVRFAIRDTSGQEVVPGPSFSHQVTLDTHRPKTVVDGPLSCMRGGLVAVSYHAVDDLSPEAHVSLRVTDSRGKTVAKAKLGTVLTGTPQTDQWRCRLPRGTYKYAIVATDLAGNRTAKPGTGRLTVR